MIRFLHLADIHLGFQQYNSRERFDDFGHAFERAMRYGAEQRVDAILIAGDLFHKAAVEPFAYLQATRLLRIARDAGIPVLAIEGNHDQARHRDSISWLRVLEQEGYLKLLDARGEGEAVALAPWDGQQRGYVDVGPVRFIGLPWLGAAASFWLPRIGGAIAEMPRREGAFTVLMTHAGIEGEIPNMGGAWSYAHLAPFRDHVDYLALGHMHKQFARAGWLHNPGSLEYCGMDEREWGHGLYDVRVDENGSFSARHVPSSPRPFIRHFFPVDRCEQPAQLLRELRDQLRSAAPAWHRDGRKPVVEVYLQGTLPFNRLALDLEALQRAIQEEADPLVARVSSAGLTLRGIAAPLDSQLSGQELEYEVLREIALSDSRFARQPDQWARVMLEVKEQAIRGGDPAAILTIIESQLSARSEG